MSRSKREKEFKKYSSKGFFLKFATFWIYKIIDVIKASKEGSVFKEFGTTFYCGRQGAGKTTAMVEYLERMREKYPKAMIITNFGYKHENQPMTDWKDFFNVKNGTDGVIFAIDEIQNEFSSSAWNKFPESLLSEITQQRKQRVKVVCTSQVFSRVAKPLREQAFDVVECVTFASRWVFTTCFDAYDYNDSIDSPTMKKKIRRLYRKNFLQDDYLRSLFDSYAKIERLERTEFLQKKERSAS